LNSSAGTDTLWENIDMDIPVSKSDLESGNFKVDICHKNELGNDVIIGSGSVGIRRAAAQLDQLKDLSISLIDSKQKASGRVVINVVISKSKSDDYKIPPDFEVGTFTISKINAFNLKNTEFVGKQDPYVVLKFGDWTDKTHTKDEAGDNATWDFLSIDCENITKQSLASQQLEVSVFDENTTRSHVLIGKGSVSLLKCASNIKEVQKLSIDLLDEKNKNSGKVVIFGALSIFEKEVELPASFEEGILKVTRISAINLKNKEFLSEGDPYVKLSLLQYKVETDVQMNKGENATWNFLDYQFRVDKKFVKGGEIEVEVWDKETLAMSDKFIGKASIPFKRAGSKLGTTTELEKAKLKNLKNEDVGSIILEVELHEVPALVKPKLELPKDFKIGTIYITEIEAIGLKNREILGKQVNAHHYFIYLKF
jgi:hypothetical protein